MKDVSSAHLARRQVAHGQHHGIPAGSGKNRDLRETERLLEKLLILVVQSSKKKEKLEKNGSSFRSFRVCGKTDELFNLPLVWQENNAGVKKFQWVEQAAGSGCCLQTERGYQWGILTH